MGQIFVFTPGQREEALTWIEKNCPDLHFEINQVDKPEEKEKAQNIITDMYFQLKSVTFNVQPNQFVIGIEYKDEQKVSQGEEKVNITLQNPHRGKAGEEGGYDLFAFQVIAELMNRLKG